VVLTAASIVLIPTASTSAFGECIVTIDDVSPRIFHAVRRFEWSQGQVDKGEPGTGLIKNVGQEVVLEAETSPGTNVMAYDWHVKGAVIEDYSVSGDCATPPSRVDPFYHITSTTNRGRIRFFCKIPSGVALRVQVFVTTTSFETCNAFKDYTVERSISDVNRQPEDYYTSCCEEEELRVVREHSDWHQENIYGISPWSGEGFLSVHESFTRCFDVFRESVGYAPLGEYDGGPVPPTELGLTIGEPTRRSNEPQCGEPDIPGVTSYCRVPTYFTRAGGSVARPNNGVDCDDPNSSGEKKLAHFDSANDLGCAIYYPWHQEIHGDIGGIMREAEDPIDPIWWRFHKFIGSRLGSLLGDWEAEKSVGPPGISTVQPPRGEIMTALPQVRVTF